MIHPIGISGGRRRVLAFLLLFLSLFLLSGTSAEEADGSFEAHLPRRLRSFTENEIRLRIPVSGILSLQVRDPQENLCAVLERDVVPGENILVWDGLGFHRQRLDSGYYTLRFILTADNGSEMVMENSVYLDVSRQALIFALPSADICYLDETDHWFLECQTVLNGTLVFSFQPRTGEGEALIRTMAVAGHKINRLSMKRILGSESLKPGSYDVTVSEASNPDYDASFQLDVQAGAHASGAEIGITGPILPERGASDAEIWQFMRQPSVVVDIGFTEHQEVYEAPLTGSGILGTLHGQTQALEVLKLEEEWALIQAWNHEEGELIQGWVPRSRLKTVQPQGQYGLLLDKKTQEISIFYQGVRIETLLVSTGRMEKGELYQETAAGAFLTGWHQANFSTNGKKYDYVMQYDGGNLIHQIPYEWGNNMRDFREGRAYLGTKASHACIRLQAEPGRQGLNAYWIWTHIPYQTRLIILDDPEERAAMKARLQGQIPAYDGSLLVDSAMDAQKDSEKGEPVVLTLGGDAVIGGRESYYARTEAFPAYVEAYGTDYPLSGLKSVFAADDWTSLNLECVLQETSLGEDLLKEWRFRGLPSYLDVLLSGHVELVNLANNHTIDYGSDGYKRTQEVLRGSLSVCGNEQNAVVELRGHLFGFGGCRETTYLNDPGVIDRDIREMKARGAEFIIYQCHWGKEYEPSHGLLQESMARACVRAGATAVIGHHPHVVQGIDVINGVPILYSLGNCVFGGTIRLKTYDGLLCQLVFYPQDHRLFLQLLPILTSSQAEAGINDYHPVLAQAEDHIRILRQVQADTVFPIHEWMEFDLSGR